MFAHGLFWVCAVTRAAIFYDLPGHLLAAPPRMKNAQNSFELWMLSIFVRTVHVQREEYCKRKIKPLKL